NVATACGNSRTIVVKSYVADRRLELIAHKIKSNPRSIVGIRRGAELLVDEHLEACRNALASYAVGLAFGRWTAVPTDAASLLTAEAYVYSGSPSSPPALETGVADRWEILVDDEGHKFDAVARIRTAWEAAFGAENDQLLDEVFRGDVTRH